MLDKSNFEILDYEKFTPSAISVLNLWSDSTKAVQNPLKSDLKTGNYKPRLTLHKRRLDKFRCSISLYIEFSIPKLLYGNNFSEVESADFDTVISTLQKKLMEMDVITDERVLMNATVTKIHYGKNFILDDYTTPYTYVEEIRRANIGKVYDANQTDYRNEGSSLRFRTNTFELIFYDKLKDLQKATISPQKSVEDHALLPKKLSKRILSKRSSEKPFEVLRMEVRLNNKKRIQSEMKMLEIDTPLTFEGLYSRYISRSICLHYLDLIKAKLIYVAHDSNKPVTDQFVTLSTSNPKIKPTDLLQYISFQMIVNETDTRTARQFIDPTNSGKWYAFQKKFSLINKPNTSYQIEKLIQKVREFKPIQAIDFSDVC